MQLIFVLYQTNKIKNNINIILKDIKKGKKMQENMLMLQNLYEKYESNEYMLKRIHNHVSKYLPMTLENELNNFEKRILRTNKLTNDQDIFIKVFLNKNRYYYYNSDFYEYDGKDYKIVNEDVIHHKLLSTISSDGIIIPWKHKTKINILKRIRETSVFSSIPDTYTIQNIIAYLCPAIFATKNEVKYFLTVIGDNILKKKHDIIYLISNKTRKLLLEIDNLANLIGISNVTHNFMTKYHETHPYSLCRLFNMNETISENIWKNILKVIGLNMLCVATHYSNRYSSSEYYINNKSDEKLQKYTLFLMDNTPSNIVHQFITNSLTTTQDISCVISWKNIHYIWKLYLSYLNLPNMIYYNTLKSILKEHFPFNAETDIFTNMTSKYLPRVSNFLLFWDKNISNSQNDEIEIDELHNMYQSTSLTDVEMLKIIHHFYPNIEIIENKYILNITCALWDKSVTINKVLALIKLDSTITSNDILSFDDMYNYYTKFCIENDEKIVSKCYFENYISIHLKDYIKFEKFIEPSY